MKIAMIASHKKRGKKLQKIKTTIFTRRPALPSILNAYVLSTQSNIKIHYFVGKFI